MVINKIKLECGAEVIVEKDTKISKDIVNISVNDIDGKCILRKNRFGEKEWNQCKGYYTYKLDYLLNGDKTITLDKPYVMFECNDRMYKVEDLDYKDNHRSLLRSCTPIGISHDDTYTINLMTFGGLHSIFTYQKDFLVFRFDDFYLNGEIVSTFKEVNETLKMSMSDIDYDSNKIKTYFENKLHIKLAGFKTENSSAEFDDYKDGVNLSATYKCENENEEDRAFIIERREK